eukprot:364433-Chlamydomonas_euryale.AAC.8
MLASCSWEQRACNATYSPGVACAISARPPTPGVHGRRRSVHGAWVIRTAELQGARAGFCNVPKLASQGFLTWHPTCARAGISSVPDWHMLSARLASPGCQVPVCRAAGCQGWHMLSARLASPGCQSVGLQGARAGMCIVPGLQATDVWCARTSGRARVWVHARAGSWHVTGGRVCGNTRLGVEPQSKRLRFKGAVTQALGARRLGLMPSNRPLPYPDCPPSTLNLSAGPPAPMPVLQRSL